MSWALFHSMWYLFYLVQQIILGRRRLMVFPYPLRVLYTGYPRKQTLTPPFPMGGLFLGYPVYRNLPPSILPRPPSPQSAGLRDGCGRRTFL